MNLSFINGIYMPTTTKCLINTPRTRPLLDSSSDGSCHQSKNNYDRGTHKSTEPTFTSSRAKGR